MRKVLIMDQHYSGWLDRVIILADDPTNWRHQVIDLDAAAASAGVTFNDHFQIKFQFYDNSSITTDGYAIDDVELHVNTAPILNPIVNPSGNYKFIVSWNTVERAKSYILQEDDNDAFSSPTNEYVGLGTSSLVTTSHAGTYYYRVKASNTYGETGWSNTQPVVVTTAPPPCPQSGPWSGSGEHFSVDFDVVGSGNLCSVQNITGHLGALCCGGGSCWTLYVEYILSMETISNHQFSASDEDTQVKGTFTTPTTVEGTWSYHHTFPYPYANCSRSGTWTGNYSP